MLCLPAPPIRLALPRPARPAINPLDHQGLVGGIVLEFIWTGLPFDDLFDEGNIGLLRAIEGFDHSRGTKFSTYATRVIRNEIGRSLDAQLGLIRVPADLAAAIRRGETPEHLTKLNPARRNCLRDAIAVRRHEVHGGLAAAHLPDRGAGRDSAMDLIDDDDSWELVREQMLPMVETLPERWATVIRLRYGLDGANVLTLDQIGVQLGVGRERVRQIENQAVARLRAGLLGQLRLQGVDDGPIQEAMRATGIEPVVPDGATKRRWRAAPSRA